ncbi:hypothetical protein MIMGU_mgv1a023254mg, partial [Erythranthe guttata]
MGIVYGSGPSVRPRFAAPNAFAGVPELGVGSLLRFATNNRPNSSNFFVKSSNLLLYWPASSLLQTLLDREQNHRSAVVFRTLFDCYKRFDFYSAYAFDLLIQSYVQSRKVLDSVVVVKSMKECGLFPEVRTVSAVLNGLIRIRRSDMVLVLFDEMFVGNDGLRPDVYVYTAVIRSLCELKDYDRAKEIISSVEKNGDCKLNVVAYNVLIHGLCKSGRVWEAVEIKKTLGFKSLKADVVTYCTLVLGLCRVDEFGLARDLVNEMGLLVNDVSYNIIIHSFCKRRKVDEAVSVLGKMLGAGIEPTVYPYNMLISGQCKLGKLSEA